MDISPFQNFVAGGGGAKSSAEDLCLVHCDDGFLSEEEDFDNFDPFEMDALTEGELVARAIDAASRKEPVVYCNGKRKFATVPAEYSGVDVVAKVANTSFYSASKGLHELELLIHLQSDKLTNTAVEDRVERRQFFSYLRNSLTTDEQASRVITKHIEDVVAQIDCIGDSTKSENQSAKIDAYTLLATLLMQNPRDARINYQIQEVVKRQIDTISVCDAGEGKELREVYIALVRYCRPELVPNFFDPDFTAKFLAIINGLYIDSLRVYDTRVIYAINTAIECLLCVINRLSLEGTKVMAKEFHTLMNIAPVAKNENPNADLFVYLLISKVCNKDRASCRELSSIYPQLIGALARIHSLSTIDGIHRKEMLITLFNGIILRNLGDITPSGSELTVVIDTLVSLHTADCIKEQSLQESITKNIGECLSAIALIYTTGGKECKQTIGSRVSFFHECVVKSRFTTKVEAHVFHMLNLCHVDSVDGGIVAKKFEDYIDCMLQVGSTKDIDSAHYSLRLLSLLASIYQSKRSFLLEYSDEVYAVIAHMKAVHECSHSFSDASNVLGQMVHMMACTFNQMSEEASSALIQQLESIMKVFYERPGDLVYRNRVVALLTNILLSDKWIATQDYIYENFPKIYRMYRDDVREISPEKVKLIRSFSDVMHFCIRVLAMTEKGCAILPDGTLFHVLGEFKMLERNSSIPFCDISKFSMVYIISRLYMNREERCPEIEALIKPFCEMIVPIRASGKMPADLYALVRKLYITSPSVRGTIHEYLEDLIDDIEVLQGDSSYYNRARCLLFDLLGEILQNVEMSQTQLVRLREILLRQSLWIPTRSMDDLFAASEYLKLLVITAKKLGIEPKSNGVRVAISDAAGDDSKS